MHLDVLYTCILKYGLHIIYIIISLEEEPSNMHSCGFVCVHILSSEVILTASRIGHAQRVGGDWGYIPLVTRNVFE